MLLNIGLAAAVFVIIVTGLPVGLALAAVLLSKWRIFAVRPRFWFANLVANMVDIIVGVSIVALLYAATGITWLQLSLTVLFAVWLLLIKPRSKRSYVALQAGVAIFLGITALSMVAYSRNSTPLIAWDLMLFVVGMWVIGFCAARHVLGSYDEPMVNQYALVFGLVVAELGWAGYHWLFAYTVPGFGNDVKLSQLALIVTLIALVLERVYRSHHRHGTVQVREVILPILFAGVTTVLLLVFFNGLSATGSI